MIINQDDDFVVPENTIAVFPITPEGENIKPFDMNFSEFLNPLNTTHKRYWFTPHFYQCLPLSIGNMQGFVFSVPFGFDAMWNGGNRPEDMYIEYHEDYEKYRGTNAVSITSEFGNGILTFHAPVALKTPPGVNLMTIAPPNFPLGGMSPMTGVVESDNLRFTFTFNIKMDLPNLNIRVPANTALVGILPIPRYFCDSFTAVNAADIFDQSVIDEEKKVIFEHSMSRKLANETGAGLDKLYYKGKDIRGNKFKDHQLPTKQ
jgi:hypothetical protein